MEKRSLIYSVYLVTFASNEFDDKNVDGELLEREIQKTRFVFLFFFFLIFVAEAWTSAFLVSSFYELYFVRNVVTC